jgi:hypothetical protein
VIICVKVSAEEMYVISVEIIKSVGFVLWNCQCGREMVPNRQYVFGKDRKTEMRVALYNSIAPNAKKIPSPLIWNRKADGKRIFSYHNITHKA